MIDIEKEMSLRTAFYDILPSPSSRAPSSRGLSRQSTPLLEQQTSEPQDDSMWLIVFLGLLTFLVIVALGLSAGLGGAALDIAKDPFFKAGGRVLSSGSNARILVSCTNDTGAATSGYANIRKGNTLTFYSTCPTPRTTCEVSFCGVNGTCESQIAPGKECAGNADCATEFGNNNYYCDTTTCTCVNGTGNSTFCCDWIDFTPDITAVNLTLDPSQSWYQYRPSGVPPAHIELNGQFFILNSAGTDLDYTIVFDISNTGLVLDSSGNYDGFAVFMPGAGAECISSRVAATSSSNITMFFSKADATGLTSTYVNFVFNANLQ